MFLNIIGSYGKLFAPIIVDEHIYVKYIIHTKIENKWHDKFRGGKNLFASHLQSNCNRSLRNVDKSVGNNSAKSVITYNILNEPGKSFCFCTL